MTAGDVTHIGPLGALRTIHCPPPSIEVTADRPNASGVTIGGRRYVQQAPRAPRMWTWALDVAPTVDLMELMALEQGVYGPAPWFFYDPMGARYNMLRPSAATPEGSLGDVVSTDPDSVTLGDPIEIDATAFVVGCENLTITPRRIVPTVAFVENLTVPAFADEPDPVPVLPDTTYTGSAYAIQDLSDESGWVLSLVWVDMEGNILSTDASATVPPGVVDRAVVTGTAPVGAAGALLSVTTGAGETVDAATAFQLTEGNTVQVWYPGIGIPRVAIPTGYVMQYLTMREGDDRYRKSISLDLWEVC